MDFTLPSGSIEDFGQPLRILLVDDEPSTLQLVRRVLEADGHEIFEAVDGEQAVEIFHETRPDLVLLDIVLPKMDGLAVLQKIRENDSITGVIMVSALSSEQLAVRSMLAGADDYVSKPFKLKTIRMDIRRVMDKVNLRRRNAALQEEVREANQKLKDIFKIFMPPSLADEMLASPTLPQLGGERKLITIMFMDICDFTPFAHQYPPDQVVSILNEMLAVATTPISENGGFLDKIMGDGFMALFPSDKSADHAQNAVRSAVTMWQRVTQWNLDKTRKIDISIGINTGEAVVGNIGTQEMMNYTAIGDTVNLAKRLQESGHNGQILVSSDTFQLLNTNELYSNSIELSSLGSRVVKGRSTPVEVFQAQSNGMG